MKKTITYLVSALLLINGLKAETVQEGVNHLYADRYKSAISVFEKMLATNPNNIEATYWLGQTYLEMDEIASARVAAARQLYEKALQTSANAPLLLVGIGHVELWEGKTSDARQHFETALTMTRTKKGDDPAILNAIGRANVDAKAGDLPYAIEKLEAAVLRDPQNADIYMNLGNAYRKARPGEGGGQAYQNYQKALAINPNFALVYVRLAAIFQSQNNKELVLQYLNEAIAKDPKFTKAYYELFYFYFFTLKFTEAEAILNKYIDSKLPVQDIQDQYLYAQICFAKKDFNCAITKAETVVAALGPKAKPKLFRLLADSYFQKGDYANAKKSSDEFFNRKNLEDPTISYDYKLKADILSKIGGTPDEIVNTYLQGAMIDTVLTSKIDFLKQGAEIFRAKGDSISRLKEGDLRLAIIKLKPSPSQRDYFDLGFAYYQGKDFKRSDSVFNFYTQKWPDSLYGWQMEFSIQRAIDTSMSLGLAVAPAIKYLEILERDTTKNRKTIIGVAGYLAQYYANIAKDKEKAIIYLEKLVMMDPTNESFKKYLEDMKKPPGKTTNPKTGNKPLPRAKPGGLASTNSNIRKQL